MPVPKDCKPRQLVQRDDDMVEWSLQEAKNRFSALVNAALAGGPRRGQPAVVVQAAEEYERLCRADKAAGPTLGELLVQIPQDDGEFERLSISARPLDL